MQRKPHRISFCHPLARWRRKKMQSRALRWRQELDAWKSHSHWNLMVMINRWPLIVNLRRSKTCCSVQALTSAGAVQFLTFISSSIWSCLAVTLKREMCNPAPENYTAEGAKLAPPCFTFGSSASTGRESLGVWNTSHPSPGTLACQSERHSANNK